MTLSPKYSSSRQCFQSHRSLQDHNTPPFPASPLGITPTPRRDDLGVAKPPAPQHPAAPGAPHAAAPRARAAPAFCCAQRNAHGSPAPLCCLAVPPSPSFVFVLPGSLLEAPRPASPRALRPSWPPSRPAGGCGMVVGSPAVPEARMDEGTSRSKPSACRATRLAAGYHPNRGRGATVLRCRCPRRGGHVASSAPGAQCHRESTRDEASGGEGCIPQALRPWGGGGRAALHLREAAGQPWPLGWWRVASADPWGRWRGDNHGKPQPRGEGRRLRGEDLRGVWGGWWGARGRSVRPRRRLPWSP